MKNKICPLCNTDENKYQFSEYGYEVRHCVTCDLFFISPYPYQIDKVYEKVTVQDYEEFESKDVKGHYQSQIEYYKHFFPIILRECRHGSSVLDVGCGPGRLLQLLRENEYEDIVGLELNTERAAMARENAQCEIVEIPIEEYDPGRKFDVIIMINVLSHIPSFDELFLSVKRLLNDNGKLILKVGEMTGDVKKDDIFEWQIPDHMHFLGLNTIEYICKKYGFTKVTHDRKTLTEEILSPMWLRMAGRSTMRNIVKRLILYTPFARLFLKMFLDKKRGRRVFSSFIVLSPFNNKKE